MKGFGEKHKNPKKKKNKPPTEKIINQAIQLHLKGNITEATKYYKQLISQECNDQRVFSNFGVILQGLGKLQDAEKSFRKAIELNPNFAMTYSNLGNVLKDLGKLQDAEKSFRKAIELNPNFAQAYSNLGNVLKDLGKLQDAEKLYRKAIELNPNFAMAYYNLGNVLKELGKLQDAEKLYRKAIELNPNFTQAYYSLSLMQYSDSNEKWQNQLFSEDIFKNKSQKDKVNIYFARANILHKEKKFEESSTYLKLANGLKLDLKPFESEDIINKSKKLLIESDKKEISNKEYNFPESIFIVGMPRCGSTLIESILSINNDVYDLGEKNILEESYLEHQKVDKQKTLSEIYLKKISNYQKKYLITTNKLLYNYQYAGLISSQITNAKIIHCFRNPLDNILSIYRANFANGNEYSSSLVDCARIYLDQEEIMCKYKQRFRSKIYDLNYDSLVCNPKKEIKLLISWLNWHWNDLYLSPHLNTRSVSTASTVQVRSPINSKSVDGWKNYKNMLQPCIEILSKTDKYKKLVN